ncbi:trypsin-like [Diorhabda carinulata]|uniref:trypsin-like n=1 Tax=Diorhabda carinulata TaxID=1163345 RepID=UPI0025A2E1D6|nr:trypsin-like [Diorhabda carinulata]
MNVNNKKLMNMSFWSFVILYCIQFRIISSEDAHLRIIGGTKCESNYPFMVSIRANNHHYCGGTLIAPQWVLTAAHCLVIKLEDVVIGSNFLIPKSTDIFFKTYIVKQTAHPDFDLDSMINDIAILKLAEPVSFLKFVELPKGKLRADITTFCNDSTVMGWGLQKIGGSPVNELSCVHLTPISLKKCQVLLGEIIAEEAKQICTFSSGKDACQGDSGGPLLCDDVQYGIVSWGVGCADDHFPGVFTRVDDYVDFIEYTMNNSEVPRTCVKFIFLMLVFHIKFFIK